MILRTYQWLGLLDCASDNDQMKFYGNEKAISQFRSHDLRTLQWIGVLDCARENDKLKC